MFKKLRFKLLRKKGTKKLIFIDVKKKMWNKQLFHKFHYFSNLIISVYAIINGPTPFASFSTIGSDI